MNSIKTIISFYCFIRIFTWFYEHEVTMKAGKTVHEKTNTEYSISLWKGTLLSDTLIQYPGNKWQHTTGENVNDKIRYLSENRVQIPGIGMFIKINNTD